MRSWAGPTGQPGLQVPDSCAALTVATVPTKGAELAGAGAVEVVGGAARVVVGTDVEVPGPTRAWVGTEGLAIRAVLEHAANRPDERRPVARRAVRWRVGRGTGAHHSRGHRAPVGLGLALCTLLMLASCGATAPSDGVARRGAPHIPPVATTAPTTVPITVATTVPPTTTAPPVVRAATPAPVTTVPHPTAPASPPPLLVTRLVGVGAATQVIAVSAGAYGQTVATLTAYQHDAAGWHQVFGPWQADVGYAGFAPPGQKHEGDGRTPSGSFGFDFFFGVLSNPGVQFPYRPITGPNIVWDDDPSSPLYNQWVDTNVSNAGAAPEPMDVSAYDYGAVIAYNMSPTVPGAGSAIFLHVSDGTPTVGCVSLPTSELLAILRWLSPAAQPRIIMGTAATIDP
jgi:L,D-peptidoglycan transpeptidase YkuD (ErfK/YbiS/YcfS/YnhG family)